MMVVSDLGDAAINTAWHLKHVGPICHPRDSYWADIMMIPLLPRVEIFDVVI